MQKLSSLLHAPAFHSHHRLHGSADWCTGMRLLTFSGSTLLPLKSICFQKSSWLATCAVHNNGQGGVWVCALACVACTFPWCIAPLHAVTALATAGGEHQRQAWLHVACWLLHTAMLFTPDTTGGRWLLRCRFPVNPAGQISTSAGPCHPGQHQLTGPYLCRWGFLAAVSARLSAKSKALPLGRLRWLLEQMCVHLSKLQGREGRGQAS